ncbi:MAG: serine hydrolase domain-containing protein [Vicingaceae bacterium]
MKSAIYLLFTLFLSSLIMAQSKQEKVIRKLDKLIEKQLKQKEIHNVYLSVYSSSKNFEWQAAKGTFKDGREVSLKHPFYTASVGKTFTATAIGILVDQGKLSFEDPIANYLSEEIMQGLHTLNGADYGDSIRIAHLLQHTSGLADYFGEPKDNTPSMLEQISTDTNHFWQAMELITFYKAHFKPLFAPGDSYFYTDTEYILLGLIVEEVSGIPFHDFLSKHIFEPLEMKHTYLNQRSKPMQSSAAMAEMYNGEQELSRFKSLSADWAGGAIVSTGKELINFHQALLIGNLVSEQTLKQMQDWLSESKGMDYGYGLRKIDFKELAPILPNWEVIGHSGLNGTFMYYCPELDVYLSGTLNQLQASKESVVFMVKVLMTLKKL